MTNIKVIGTPLYQWEVGRKVQIIPLRKMRIDAVHVSNYGDTEALVVEPREENGMIVADIPNILLQSGNNLVVYSVNVSADSVETIMYSTFAVNPRPKPADYVYTETEVYNIKTAVEKALQEAKESGEFKGEPGKDGEIKKIVSDASNPVTVPSLKSGAYILKGTFRTYNTATWTTNFDNCFAVIQKMEGAPHNKGYMHLHNPGSNAIHHYDFDEFHSTLTRGDLKYLSEVPKLQERVSALEENSGGNVDLTDYVKKTDYEKNMGDVEAALDAIIEIQNSLIGGGSV